MTKSYRHSAEALKSYVVWFLTHLGVPPEDARTVVEVLIAANLRGIICLYTYYGNRLCNGFIDAKSLTRLIRETRNSALLDGGNGLGQVVAHRAMSLCIKKAEDVEIAAVSVRNSNHYRIVGYYAMIALGESMIGMSTTNSQPLIALIYGRKALLGTNAIAVAVPGGTQRLYVLDIASSIVPIGRNTVYEKADDRIPTGWAIDTSGHVTQSPTAVLDEGALLPLGETAETQGYKGYGLALLIEILSGVLSGAATGPDVGHPSWPGKVGLGHFPLAMDVEAFRPLKAFEADMDRLIDTLKNAPKVPDSDRIYIHGEKEFELAERYAQKGIPLMAEVVNDLGKAGQMVGVPFDVELIGPLDS